MTLNFNLQGAERKNLVNAISEILEAPAVYLKAPTFAYQVSECHIDKNGLLTGADNNELADALRDRGFIAETAYEEEFGALEGNDREETYAEGEAEEIARDIVEILNTPTEATEAKYEDEFGLTVGMPLDGFSPEKLDNLTRLVASKETLLKAALGLNELPIQITEDSIYFPWYVNAHMPTADEAQAFTELVSLLCETAKEKKRITAKDNGLPENLKYAFRCFLLSIGMIGKEYNTSRKVLLSRLSGNSSWKSGKPEQAV